MGGNKSIGACESRPPPSSCARLRRKSGTHVRIPGPTPHSSVALKAPLQGPHLWRPASCCPRANGRVRSLFAPKSQGDSHPPHGNKTTSPWRSHGPNERRGGREEGEGIDFSPPSEKKKQSDGGGGGGGGGAFDGDGRATLPRTCTAAGHTYAAEEKEEEEEDGCLGGKGGAAAGRQRHLLRREPASRSQKRQQPFAKINNLCVGDGT